jgi:hypothetical protein
LLQVGENNLWNPASAGEDILAAYLQADKKTFIKINIYEKE